jgi:hypothetical protein
MLTGPYADPRAYGPLPADCPVPPAMRAPRLASDAA